jgi:hypothetical protein
MGRINVAQTLLSVLVRFGTAEEIDALVILRLPEPRSATREPAEDGEGSQVTRAASNPARTLQGLRLEPRIVSSFAVLRRLRMTNPSQTYPSTAASNPE